MKRVRNKIKKKKKLNKRTTMKWRERGTHLNNCFWFSFLPPPHQVDDVRFIRTSERYSRAWATHSQLRKIPYYPESKPFAILPTVGKGTRTFSRPPRGRSPRAFHAPSSSMPVGSSHYDVARWKMLGGTDDLLLHEEKILCGSRRRDSWRKKNFSCRGDSDFCVHLPCGVKIFALPTNSVAYISYVWVYRWRGGFFTQSSRETRGILVKFENFQISIELFLSNFRRSFN